jgi:protocatechuate 3,4-dioxygenase beta subunit
MSHDHGPEGLAEDLGHFRARRAVMVALGMGLAGAGIWAVRGGAQSVGTAADGSLCYGQPAETAGPFPADGTNSSAGRMVNILTEAGVVREDIRGSIGGLTPVAEGVPLILDLQVVNVNAACAPLAGHAVYLWQCDAEGIYSIYAAADRNYLRGVGISDADGRLRFTTIIPACYDGRWPHLHFEVFASAQAATSGDAALLTSQFALPEAECRAVYDSQPLYASSRRTIEGVTLDGDGIFRNGGEAARTAQLLVLSGDPSAGYRSRSVIGLAL